MICAKHRYSKERALHSVITGTDVLLSESFGTSGAKMFKQACEMGLEGVVSKVRERKYVSGRTNHWVKVTCGQRETLPIAGFVFDGNKWDGIYLARRKGG
jgi:bifunctional non-homologous end joining protein LigD